MLTAHRGEEATHLQHPLTLICWAHTPGSGGGGVRRCCGSHWCWPFTTPLMSPVTHQCSSSPFLSFLLSDTLYLAFLTGLKPRSSDQAVHNSVNVCVHVLKDNLNPTEIDLRIEFIILSSWPKSCPTEHSLLFALKTFFFKLLKRYS